MVLFTLSSTLFAVLGVSELRRAASFASSLRPHLLSQKQHHPANDRRPLRRLESSPSNEVAEMTGRGQPSTEKIPYNWKDQWYALTYSSYVPDPSKSAESIPAAVFGEPLVLWREEDGGVIYCADDVCPHRAAALSEGRVRDGKLECLYHGWQYKGEKGGSCERIPQLEKDAEIPRRACLSMRACRVSEGMVWVWMGDEEPTAEPPNTGLLDSEGKAEGWSVYDFMIDLPYDHSYLIENLLDPAHIAISHDRTPGGGKRELAEGYEMEVDEDSFSSGGFTGQFRQLSRQPEGAFTAFEFEAPGIIRNRFAGKIKGNDFRFEAGLHCMPVGLGRSRLFFRVYNKGLPAVASFILGLKPLWLRHLNSCKVLEQDVGLIATQEDHFSRTNRQLADDFLLLKSSDTYVGAYRRWLDRVGDGMPWFQGLASSSNPNAHVPAGTIQPGISPASHRSSNQDVVETRYHRHVMHCPATRTALRNVKRCKLAFKGLAGAALTLACALVPSVVNSPSAVLLRLFRAATIALPIGMIGAIGARMLEREFYTSFKRKDQLRTESGLIP